MNYLSRKIIFFILIIHSLLLTPACKVSEETYAVRVANCLKNSEDLGLEFEVVETGQKGRPHIVKPACLLGAKLPEFELTDMNGNTINTNNIKGKINIINFWFIHCAPCVEEIPDLNTLVQKYNRSDINFLAIVRDQPEQLQEFLKEHPFHFTILPNGTDVTENQFHLMWGYPFTLITDKENRIIGAIRAGGAENRISESIIQKVEAILEDYRVNK
ncbi:MAG: TlpA family protein disulfide reductase [Saprospiraceae bacterium]